MEIACLDDEKLADYLEGRLSEKERFRIEEHLSECETCLDRLMIANDLMREEVQAKLDTVPAHVTETAVRLVQAKGSGRFDSLPEILRRSIRELYSKLSDFFRLKPWGELQLQPIRGSKKRMTKDLILLKKTFKDIETEIEIEKTGPNKTNIRVIFPKDSELRQGTRVTLKKAEREVASHLSDGIYVLFEGIPFGPYTLSFTREGIVVGTYAFEIKETGHGER